MAIRSRNAVNLREPAMATKRKVKGKAKPKRKKMPVSKGAGKKTVKKAKTVRKKITKKAPPRPASRKKARAAKPAGNQRSIDRSSQGTAKSPGKAGIIRATYRRRNPLLQSSVSCGHAARARRHVACWRDNPRLGTHNRFHAEGRIAGGRSFARR